ncbi:CBS domain-containing protein [Aliikangiella sp. IMCC44653]
METPLIADIISSHYLAVSPDCLLSDAIKQMSEQKVSCVMVVEDNKPMGIITESDALVLFAESFEGVCWKELSVSHVMTYPVIAASFDLDVLEAVIIAQGGKIRHIPITDENGELIGVANQTELVQTLVAMNQN